MKLNELLSIAKKELGTRETPENVVKYNDAYWGEGYKADGASYPWCVVFQWWCARQAGGDSTFFPNTAHCDGVRSFAKGIGRWINHAEIGVGAEIKVGDYVIFDYNGDGSGDHIGLVEKIINKLSYVCLEGNYSDGVYEVTRTLEYVSGIYRPQYDEEQKTEEPKEEYTPKEDGEICVDLPTLKVEDVGQCVELMQFLLMLHDFKPKNSLMSNGHFDGEFGECTEYSLKEFQNSVGILSELGICGNLTWSALLEVEE